MRRATFPDLEGLALWRSFLLYLANSEHPAAVALLKNEFCNGDGTSISIHQIIQDYTEEIEAFLKAAGCTISEEDIRGNDGKRGIILTALFPKEK